MTHHAVRRIVTLGLVLTLLSDALGRSAAWAANPGIDGMVQRIELSQTAGGVRVDVLGSQLHDYYDVATKDAYGGSQIYLSFYDATLDPLVEKKRNGLGIVSRIEVTQISQDPRKVTQVALFLSSEAPYRIQKIAEGVRLEIAKAAGKAPSKKEEKPVTLSVPKAVPAAVPVTPPVMAEANDAVSERSGPSAMIQAGDAIYISVSPAEELSRDLNVDQNGRIAMPLVGSLDVAGLTAEDLARALTKKLSQYVNRPSVNVLVRQSSSQHVMVMGQVRSSGSFPYRSQMRLLDLISSAGGFAPTANRRHIRIQRGSGASRRALIVDIDEAFRTGDGTKDFPLEPGDLVDVPRGSFGLTVFGEVQAGGTFDFVTNTRMLDLISMARGFSDAANVKKIVIFRGEAPNQKIIRVKFAKVLKGDQSENLLLEPGDIIYVPKRPLWSASATVSTFTPIMAIGLTISTIILAVKK